VVFRSRLSLCPVLLSRIAFVTALAVSAACFALSLAGIVSAGGDVPSAKKVERPAPVVQDDCPGDEREHAAPL
jgi:hypothetical protein